MGFKFEYANPHNKRHASESWQPLEPQPHKVDVKALFRIAVLYNIPKYSDRLQPSTSEFLISSHLIKEPRAPVPPRDHSKNFKRKVVP